MTTLNRVLADKDYSDFINDFAELFLWISQKNFTKFTVNLLTFLLRFKRERWPTWWSNLSKQLPSNDIEIQRSKPNENPKVILRKSSNFLKDSASSKMSLSMFLLMISFQTWNCSSFLSAIVFSRCFEGTFKQFFVKKTVAGSLIKSCVKTKFQGYFNSFCLQITCNFSSWTFKNSQWNEVTSSLLSQPPTHITKCLKLMYLIKLN